jgi:hypothetical protein
MYYKICTFKKIFIKKCMSMSMLHGLTNSTEIDKQHGRGHAARTWTCSMDMDMQHGMGK